MTIVILHVPALEHTCVANEWVGWTVGRLLGFLGSEETRDDLPEDIDILGQAAMMGLNCSIYMAFFGHEGYKSKIGFYS